MPQKAYSQQRIGINWLRQGSFQTRLCNRWETSQYHQLSTVDYWWFILWSTSKCCRFVVKYLFWRRVANFFPQALQMLILQNIGFTSRRSRESNANSLLKANGRYSPIIPSCGQVWGDYLLADQWHRDLSNLFRYGDPWGSMGLDLTKIDRCRTTTSGDTRYASPQAPLHARQNAIECPGALWCRCCWRWCPIPSPSSHLCCR